MGRRIRSGRTPATAIRSLRTELSTTRTSSLLQPAFRKLAQRLALRAERGLPGPQHTFRQAFAVGPHVLRDRRTIAPPRHPPFADREPRVIRAAIDAVGLQDRRDGLTRAECALQVLDELFREIGPATVLHGGYVQCRSWRASWQSTGPVRRSAPASTSGSPKRSCLAT